MFTMKLKGSFGICKYVKKVTKSNPAIAGDGWRKCKGIEEVH